MRIIKWSGSLFKTIAHDGIVMLSIPVELSQLNCAPAGPIMFFVSGVVDVVLPTLHDRFPLLSTDGSHALMLFASTLAALRVPTSDRKSTRLNSSHQII